MFIKKINCLDILLEKFLYTISCELKFLTVFILNLDVYVLLQKWSFYALVLPEPCAILEMVLFSNKRNNVWGGGI